MTEPVAAVPVVMVVDPAPSASSMVAVLRNHMPVVLWSADVAAVTPLVSPGAVVLVDAPVLLSWPPPVVASVKEAGVACVAALSTVGGDRLFPVQTRRWVRRPPREAASVHAGPGRASGRC